MQTDKEKGGPSTKIAAGEAVRVNDENGDHLTKIEPNESVDVALQRLPRRFGTGALEDKNGVALLDSDIITAEKSPYVFIRLEERQEQPEDPHTRFRRLAESAAIVVTETVMKSAVFHFSSQMAIVNTPEQAADLYKRASRIPCSAAEIRLQEKNIAVANIFGGTDTAKSTILEAFESGRPCLLKIH